MMEVVVIPSLADKAVQETNLVGQPVTDSIQHRPDGLFGVEYTLDSGDPDSPGSSGDPDGPGSPGDLDDPGVPFGNEL